MAIVTGNHYDYIMIIYMIIYDIIHIRHDLAEAERNSSLLTLKNQGAILGRSLWKGSCGKKLQVAFRS